MDEGVYDLIVEVINDLVNEEKLHSSGEKDGLKKTVMEVLNGVQVEGTKYTYNQGDQLVLKENLITGDFNEYAYDSRGNMTGDGDRDYTYDAQDRLVQTTDEKSRTTKYTYDSFGRRLAVDFNGEVTKYNYLGESDKVSKEVRPDGSEISFTYDNEGTPLTMKYNGQTYYYLFNGHGDVAALTDAQGTKVASYRYDPWGKVLKADEEEVGEESVDSHEVGELNPYRYAGYRYDTKTKLYFLKTRYYNPQIGRFISRDKYRAAEGDDTEIQPIAQNKYIYVNNNPVNMVDPNGQWGSGVKPNASSPKTKPAATPSTVKGIAKAAAPKASIQKIVQNGSKVGTNLKVNGNKVTPKARKDINKSYKTQKNLTYPKTMNNKNKAFTNGIKATMGAIKKLVSGGISKTDKFAGVNKLAYLNAAKTAKGSMVKYAMPNSKKMEPFKKVVNNSGKYKKGEVLKLFETKKSGAGRAAEAAKGRIKDSKPDSKMFKKPGVTRGTGIKEQQIRIQKRFEEEQRNTWRNKQGTSKTQGTGQTGQKTPTVTTNRNNESKREAARSGAIDAGGFAIDSAFEEIGTALGKRVTSPLGTAASGVLTGMDVNATLDNKKYTTGQKITKVTIQVVGGGINVAFGTVIGGLAVGTAVESGGASLVGGAAVIGGFSYGVNRGQTWLYGKLGL